MPTHRALQNMLSSSRHMTLFFARLPHTVTQLLDFCDGRRGKQNGKSRRRVLLTDVHRLPLHAPECRWQLHVHAQLHACMHKKLHLNIFRLLHS